MQAEELADARPGGERGGDEDVEVRRAGRAQAVFFAGLEAARAGLLGALFSSMAVSPFDLKGETSALSIAIDQFQRCLALALKRFAATCPPFPERRARAAALRRSAGTGSPRASRSRT